VKTTVIIPSYNRSVRLRETLEALERQSYRNFSVIVVHDGSNDSGYHNSGLFKNLTYETKIVHQTNAGASAATNHGVELAEDGLIILFDDDIIPDPDCIAKHVAFHEQTTNAILSGSADTDPARTITDVQRYKLHMEEQWRKHRPDTEALVKVGFDNFIITTANMSLDRSLYISLGGFNTSFRDGYDVEFGFKALRSNVELYFDRRIHTIHNDQISLRYYAKRQNAYTKAKRNLITSYPEVSGSFSEAAEYRPSTTKRFFYSIFRQNWFVNFAESRLFVNLIPKYFRYRIYGSTIAALSIES
jgi:glycosyltransferase involved in cell wall biosynthesis